MVSHNVRQLTEALRNPACREAALEIAQRWLEEMREGSQREELQEAVNRAS